MKNDFSSDIYKEKKIQNPKYSDLWYKRCYIKIINP